ncbi:MAG: hypothetical protein U0835_19040 [Isosphaeraceae bacterium]
MKTFKDIGSTLRRAWQGRARGRRGFEPSVDGLEDRVALTTAVNFDPATATLTVAGDDLANRISVTAVKGAQASTGSIVVVADGQTTRFNSVADLKNIQVTGGGGNDLIGVYFRGFRPSTVGVSGDAGSDVIGVAGGGTIFDYLNGSPVTNLALNVSGDGSADAASAGNDTVAVSLDGLTLENSTISADGGLGNDKVAVVLSAVSLGTGTQVNALGGDGDDSAVVSLNDDQARGASIAVDGGSGRNSLAFAVAGLKVGGTTTGNGLDVRLDGSAGDSGNKIGLSVANLKLQAGARARLDVLGGSGNDQVGAAFLGLNLGSGSTFTANVQPGGGDDRVSAVVILPLGTGQGTLNLDGGPGNDSLVLVAPRVRRGSTSPLTVNVVNFESQRGT